MVNTGLKVHLIREYPTAIFNGVTPADGDESKIRKADSAEKKIRGHSFCSEIYLRIFFNFKELENE